MRHSHGADHCWKCQAPFDGSEASCSKCGSGVICNACGVCRCDFGQKGRRADPVTIREQFVALADAAADEAVVESYDPDPVERALLSALIQESGLAGALLPKLIMGTVAPDEFANKAHRKIAERLYPRVEKGQRINAPLLRHIFRAKGFKEEALKLLGEVYDPKSIPVYLAEVQKQQRITSVVNAMLPAAKELLSDCDDAQIIEVVSKVRAEIGKPLSQAIAPIPDKEHLVGFYDALETNQREQDYLGLNSGFAHVNRICNGLRPELILFAGPPSLGKTSLVRQIQYQVATLEGVPTIFFSFEQSRAELHIKDLARVSGVSNRDIMRGKLAKDSAEWKQVQAAAVTIYGHSNKIYTVEADATFHVGKMAMFVEAVMKLHNTTECAVFVDYMQKIGLPADSAYQQRRDEISYQCSELRRMVRDLNVPVIVVSSESRAAYNKRDIAVFKESGEIEYSADIAAILSLGKSDLDDVERRTVRGRQDPASGIRPVTLTVAKNRNGELGVVHFAFHEAIAKFEEKRFEERRYAEGFETQGTRPGARE